MPRAITVGGFAGVALVAGLLSISAFAGAGDTGYTEGVAAMKAGDFKTAVTKLTACTVAEPTRSECWWELGWANWSTSNWDATVSAWEHVEKLDPTREKLAKSLGDARDAAAGAKRMREAAAGAPATARPAVPKGRTLHLRAVGDIMIGSDFPTPIMPPDDGVTYFDATKPLLRDAEVTFGNFEGPLCDSGKTEKCSADSTACYAFRTPTRYAALYKDAGFDLGSTANNHAGDFGDECRRQTEATLDAQGIVWSGSPGSIGTLKLQDGLTIGLVAFHTAPNVNNVNDLVAAEALVKVAKQTHDWVIVSFHGGAEGSKAQHVPNGPEKFYGENRGDLRLFAKTVIGAGADLVLGHGPHVVRGMEIVDGHLVAYSMGNFATYGRFNLSGNLSASLILDVTLDSDGAFVGGKILPIRLQGEGIPAPDAEGTSIDLIRLLSTEDFPSTSPLIGKDGTIGPR